MKRVMFPLLMGSLMAAAVGAAAIPAAAAPLSVCINKSSASAPMDRKLAAAVADRDNVSVATREFDGDDEGFALKNFVAPASRDCDLVLGFPLDATKPEPPAGLAATLPYAHVGLVLAEPAARRERGLADFPPGSDVGVTYLTTPNLFFEAHPNVMANVFDTEAETLQSLLSHQVKAALLWWPTVVRYQQDHPDGQRLAAHELTEAHAQFDIVALCAPRGAAAARRFEAAVATLRQGRALGAILRPYALPGAAPAPASEHAAMRYDAASQHTDDIPAGAAVLAFVADADAAGAPPALYTQAQAQAGAQKFLANCATCHGRDLTGIAGPALKGRNFASAKANFQVSDVFRILSTNMPAPQAGTLAHDDYVEIMAFLLQQNAYPAGPQALTFVGALNSAVPLRYHAS
jgi:mono/diheme cytochrome c family protein